MLSGAYQRLELKDSYRHNQDDLITDFYLPVLSACKRFYRAAGYFSSSIFSETLLGIKSLVENDGIIRLVTSFNLTGEDVAALKKLNAEGKSHYISRSIVDLIENSYSNESRKSVEIFCWLISNKRLEIRIVFGDSSENFLRLYHEKIGLFESVDNEWLAFKGSVNESQSAYTLNFESIEVFKKWETSDKRRFDRIYDDFSNLWTDQTKGLSVLCLNSAALDLIDSISRGSSLDKSSVQLELSKHQEALALGAKTEMPLATFRTPTWFLQGMYDHQKQALVDWRKNDFNGFFEYATGSGKTLTALYCSQQLFTEKNSLFVLVLTPQVFIAEQWCRESMNFGIRPIKCFGGRQTWEERLREAVFAYSMGIQKIVIAIAVNATATSAVFQGLIGKVEKNLLVIGDEAHNLGAQANLSALPKNKHYSIGLSATPKRFMDGMGTDSMLSYFGGVVSRFELKDALELKILTPYFYKIIPVYLLPEEEDEFTSLTREIRALSGRGGEDGANLNESDEIRLKKLRLRRAKLLSNTPAKVEALKEELRNRIAGKKTIVYCGSGAGDEETKLIDQVVKVFQQNPETKVAKFTSCEKVSERESVLKMLRDGEIDVSLTPAKLRTLFM